MEAADGTMVEMRRPCLEDTVLAKRRWEVPRLLEGDVEVPPMRLHIVVDQGPVGWPWLWHMYRSLHVSGALEPDRPHVGHGAVRRALRRAGLCGPCLKFAVVVHLSVFGIRRFRVTEKPPARAPAKAVGASVTSPQRPCGPSGRARKHSQ